MWLLLLLARVALAGPVADLAEAVGGTPVVAVRCDHASRVLSPTATGSALGLGAFAQLSKGDRQVFDLDAPLLMTVTASKDGSTLAVDAGLVTGNDIAAELADPAFKAHLPKGAQVTQHADRVRFILPQKGAFTPSDQPVVAKVEGAKDPGCVLAVDVPGLLAGAKPPFPLLDKATVLEARFESPKGVHHVDVAVSGVPAAVAHVLEGQGEPGLAGARSKVHFPVVLQVHGTVKEVAAALAKLSAGANGLMYAAAADEIPKRVKGEPGLLLALGTPKEGGAIVVPMYRPSSPKRLIRILERLAGKVDAKVQEQANGMLKITPNGKPPVTAGVKKGLVVIAMRSDVVRDVLAGSGEEWLPPADGAYGLRLRATKGMLAALGPLDGYIQARYTDGVLHIDVHPTGSE